MFFFVFCFWGGLCCCFGLIRTTYKWILYNDLRVLLLSVHLTDKSSIIGYLWKIILNSTIVLLDSTAYAISFASYVRGTVGESGLCRCVGLMSFEHYLNPLFVDFASQHLQQRPWNGDFNGFPSINVVLLFFLSFFFFCCIPYNSGQILPSPTPSVQKWAPQLSLFKSCESWAHT